jgi:hypothetical protein
MKMYLTRCDGHAYNPGRLLGSCGRRILCLRPTWATGLHSGTCLKCVCVCLHENNSMYIFCGTGGKLVKKYRQPLFRNKRELGETFVGLLCFCKIRIEQVYRLREKGRKKISGSSKSSRLMSSGP